MRRLATLWLALLLMACATTQPVNQHAEKVPDPIVVDPGPFAMSVVEPATFCLWAKTPMGKAAGTAVCIFTDNGKSILVTAGHCYMDGAEFTITHGDKTYNAIFFHVSSTYDLGFLYVEARLPVVPFGCVPKLGARVYVIGNKLGGGHLWPSEGIYGGRVNKGFSVISAPIHPGNSGGPVVNEKGQLIGIASRILVHSGTRQLLPTTAMMVPLDNLLEAILAGNIAGALIERPEALVGKKPVILPPLPTEFE